MAVSEFGRGQSQGHRASAGMEYDQPSPKKGPACPGCGGRLRLLADQIGTQVTCPKCNATFMVGRPGARPTAATSTSDDNAYEPEIPLKRSSIVPEEPPAVEPPPPPAQYDADWDSVVPQREPPHVRPLDLEPDYLASAEARGLLRTEVVVDPP